MSKARVFVIEDEYLVGKAVKRQLENLGYEVIGMASNAEKGVAEVARLIPDLVLMDIGLPGEDGIQACRRLMQTSPLPIIMLTAYDDEERLTEAVEAGSSGYLLKPTTEQNLDDCIQQVLSQGSAPTSH